jgi:hypothetical protein
MHSNPGVYALLLGSGVSSAAGIPTGQEIVLNLIQKLAAMQRVETQPDWMKWYHEIYGCYPKYDELLERFAPTQTERMALLRSYFEPNSEEKEQGLKEPTKAHRAIAKLVALGYVRIIITTNFDCIMENALVDEGIAPDIISSIDYLKGALPYVHSKCYIVKLHGDYRDSRIKNTPEELACYPIEMNSFLDRVFDEFGLIICGWSSFNDKALRDAILRCPSRRFTTFWLSKGEPIDEAKQLIQHRRAEVILIDDANQSFIDLVENVKSLRDLESSSPISIELAVATIKRYIVDPQYKIRLHDLMRDETERVYQELISEKFSLKGINSVDQFHHCLHQYEALVEKLMAMFACLSYYDNGDNAYLLTKCIERLANPQRNDVYSQLCSYPALLLVYSGSIAAIEANNYRNLHAILAKPKYREYYQGAYSPAIQRLNPAKVFGGYYNYVPISNPSQYDAASIYIFDVVKNVLCGYIPDDAKLNDRFDLFEYIQSAVHRDLIRDRWSPLGRFTWKYRMSGGLERSHIAEFISSGLKEKEEWELLKAGFFEGSMDRFEEVLQEQTKWIQSAAK